MFSSAAIDRLFAQWARQDSPGAVVGVTRHGVLVHEGHYGMADLANAVPLNAGSVQRIASQTKHFTVLLALMLEAEGKLSMDDDVRRYLPWLPEYPDKVTLHHLATNTGGLRDFLEIMAWSGLPLASASTRQTSRDLLARHAEVNFVPGTAMLYSNTGFFLLSEIVEAVSGRSFNELLESRITGRVGMPDTRLMPRDAEILPRLVTQHAKGANGGWEKVHWGFPLGGEGGMVSTLKDMLAWQATLAAPPAEWTGFLARMTAPLHYANGTETLYRMGLVVDRYRGLHGIGHGGSAAGARSESIRFPDQGLGVVVLGNVAEMSPLVLARRIADICLDAEATPHFGPEGAARMRAAAGLYREEGGGEVFAIGAAEEELSFTSCSGSSPLEEVAPGSFAPERPIMHLVLTPRGEGVMDAVFCGAAQRYRRVPEKAAGRDLSGRYANAGLGLEAAVEGTSMLIRSDVGTLRVALERIDGDLSLVRPQAAGPRPWLGSLRETGDGLVLTTDRTKGLLLRPA